MVGFHYRCRLISHIKAREVTHPVIIAPKLPQIKQSKAVICVTY